MLPLSIRRLLPLAFVAFTGCATTGALAPLTDVRTSETTVDLPGRSLTLHIALPTNATSSDVLVIYATGDAGWFGEAKSMYSEIGHAGYAVAGFSAKAFLHDERTSNDIDTTDELVDGYRRVIARAHEATGVPERAPVVLVGWSRGAALSVLVAGESKLQSSVAGVIAIGLPDEEELRVRSSSDAGPERAASSSVVGGRTLRFNTYERIQTLGPILVEVIQATHDDYLPADQARVRFGPDSATRRLVAIDAENHRFSGGRTAFAAALRDALWRLDRFARPSTRAGRD